MASWSKGQLTGNRRHAWRLTRVAAMGGGAELGMREVLGSFEASGTSWCEVDSPQQHRLSP